MKRAALSLKNQVSLLLQAASQAQRVEIKNNERQGDPINKHTIKEPLNPQECRIDRLWHVHESMIQRCI